MKIQMAISALLLVSLSMLTACGGDDEGGSGNPQEPTAGITLSQTEFTFGSEGGSGTLTLTAPREWDATSSADWVKLTKENTLEKQGTISFTVGKNDLLKQREATVTVLSGTARGTFKIVQAAREPDPEDSKIEAPEGYTLAWHDEFDGETLGKDWTHEVQGSGWVNNEQQNYVSGSYDGTRVTEVSDGTLKITCFKASNGKIYSGRIYAKVNEGWKYGIIEARIKLPQGKGTWPAFWMMPVNNDWSTTPWPNCGEIDIMEEVGYHPNYTSSSIHCEKYNHMIGTQKTAERYTAGAEDDFHVYRLEWTADYIKTYVDGNPLLNFPNDKLGSASTWPFSKAFYVILNLAWGGDWGGQQGTDESKLPATMTVDYVRVFQQ